MVVRKLYGALGAALVVLVTACGGSDSTGTGTTTTNNGNTGTTTNPTLTTSVDMINSAFVPPAIQVSPGATVTFTNSDNTLHNVTFSLSSIARTGDFSSGSKSIAMPATPGTYLYSCTIHPGMNGSVKVQ